MPLNAHPFCPTLQVLALPCMCGARVAVNCRPIGTHHSGILEDNGQSIRCDQCVAEVEAKAQRLAACAARSAEEDGGAWNKEEALRRASSSRLQFKKHCCGLSEGKSAHTEFLELVDVRLSLRVSRDAAGVGLARGWGFGVGRSQQSMLAVMSLQHTN